MIKIHTGNYSWTFNFISTPITHIVEVGSRDAVDAIELSNHFNAKVFSFEPDPECFSVCIKSLEQNKHLPITLYNMGLGGTNSLSRFYIYSSGNSSLYKHKSENIKEIIDIQLVRFDSLDLPSPDLLVIDAQSSEFQILEGFGKNLSKAKYIVFETGFYSIYETDHNYDFINKYLKNLGFNFLATNVSGKGRLSFYLMRIRGIFYNLRKHGIKGINAYSGFFDVLYINNSIDFR